MNKRCELCGHSREAHVDGVKCALCTCMSRPREFVQQSLTFRSTLSTTSITRKR